MDFWGQIQEILNFTIFGADWEEPVNLGDLIVATAILFVARLVSRFLRKALEPLAERAEPLVGQKAVKVTLRVIHWLIILAGVIVALNTLNINLSSLSGLFTAGAVVTVAVGFAMQNIAQNFVSGALLAAERSIKAGDVLQVEGTVIRVENMGIRTTVARTRDDEEIIIPNSHLVQNSVRNFTYQDSIYRLRAPVGVAYESDMKLVRETLEKVAKSLEWRTSAKNPVVLLQEFGNSSVLFEVSVWVNDPWRAPQLHSELMEAVWFALKDAGVTIAFPQMDLHLDRKVVEALGRGRSSGGDPGPPEPHMA